MNYVEVTGRSGLHFHPDADHKLYVLEGRVVNSEYGGRDSLLDVIVGDDVVLHARTAERRQPGDLVKLTVAPDRVLVYPSEGGA